MNEDQQLQENLQQHLLEHEEEEWRHVEIHPDGS